MKIFALRLHPGDDIKKEIIKFTKKNSIQAGFIISAVGSVTRATLRMADETVIKDFDKKHEIICLDGTLSQDDVHLHMSLSDEDGNVIGGHLKEGCLVYVTLELVVGESEELKFSRKYDEETGFKELVINKK